MVQKCKYPFSMLIHEEFQKLQEIFNQTINKLAVEYADYEMSPLEIEKQKEHDINKVIENLGN